MAPSTNDHLDPLFVIERDCEGQQIKLYTNKSGLLEFIRFINVSLNNESGQPTFVESKRTPLIEIDDEAHMLDKAEIYTERSWLTKDTQAPLLSFEWNKETNRIEIHGNYAGLQSLKGFCSDLVKGPPVEHEHLMAPEWGGKELTDRSFNPLAVSAKHVKIIRWD